MAAAEKPETFKLVPASIMEFAKTKELSPEMLADMFKEIGASPEKLRAVLNLWFVPRFRPSFVPDPDYAVSGLQDVEFLGTLEPQPAQLPYRMFDIKTGNLVEFPAIGARGQYCILSHRWKGIELLLGDIKRARAEDLDRAKETIRQAKAIAGNAKSAAGEGDRKDDVQLVLEQCRIDIEKQEEVVKELYLADESAATSGNFSLGELLDRRLEVKAMENRLEWAKNSEDSTRTQLRFAEMESEIFRDLINKARKEVDNKMKGSQVVVDASNEANTTDQKYSAANDHGGQGKGVVSAVKGEVKKAKDELKAATEEYKAKQNDVDFFKNHSRIRDALDEMVCHLQRWKSAIKLDRVIKEADRIFKEKLFQHREKCYLWTDTCCIDKTNAGELSESLSLMGDWYANAEFCLVQLDTESSDADAALDWRRFRTERGREPEPLAPNLVKGPRKIISGFEHIADSRPEWSSRAWTLQELVMSKTTFYLNSEWKDLSRPVESLGYFYHLMPFIALYSRRDTRNMYISPPSETPTIASKALSDILKDYSVPVELKSVRSSIQKAHTSPPSANSNQQEVSTSVKAAGEAVRIDKALQLIMILDGLGVRFPKDMTLETATSEMARAVYLAAADIAGDDSDTSRSCLLASLKSYLNGLVQDVPEEDKVQNPRKWQEKEALHAINFLLKCLVNETLNLILEDREYVAQFGQVEQLTAWQEGKRRSGFAAQSVLAVSGKRKATVATDRAYALMGVLGVRFPTFPAEGYAMALARLLDQVLITHNDVSVFNWAGMEMGSPIRGRSLYPSSHVAFGNHDDRGRHYNLLLASQVQTKMDDVMETYHKIIFVLRQAIDAVKDKRRTNLPFGWILQIIHLVRFSGFHALKLELKSVSKVIGYIIQNCAKDLSNMKETEGDKGKSAASSPSVSKTLSFSSIPSPSFPSMPSPSLSLPSPPLSMSGFKIGSSKKEPDNADDSSKRGSRFSGFGKKSSFGFGKQIPEPVAETKPLAVSTATPVSPQSLVATTAPPDTPSKPSWVDLDEAVTKHLNYISRPANEREKSTEGDLPAELRDVEFDVLGPKADIHANKPGITTRLGFGQDYDHESTISPNPIIVNNSGIEGLFDIQRVIVTMIDHDQLRARIAKAVTPRDKISGWCSISTGFARVIASFSCEKRLLEQELDAVEGVEVKILKEQYKDKDEKRGALLLKDMVVSGAGAAIQELKPGVTAEGTGEEEGEGKKVEGSEKTDDIDKETEEERLVSRMIEFIQEPQLQLVAGEWVLARFSGVPGARWFLCHLQLGSAPGQLYGHRIATGEIDFSNSTPEPGLVKAWQTYMERKKRKMCYVLDRYLKSRMSAKESKERLDLGMRTMDKAREQAMEQATKRMDSLGFGASSGTNKKEESDDVEKAGSTRKDDSDDEGGSAFDQLLDQGKLAARAFGEFTVLAMVEKFFEMRAEHLDKTLSIQVLKRTPKSLRTAVENMNDNKSLLPAMFHSSTRVHMF